MAKDITEFRNITIPRETDKAYLVRQTIRHDDIEVWIPKSVVPYKLKHPREEDKEQSYNIHVEDWWLAKNECPLQ